MQTRLAYAVSFLAIVLLVVFPLLTNTSARSHEQQTSSLASQPLTPSERRGKQIYLRTTSPSAREITAKIGELDVPGSSVTCAGCHGTRGEGKTEGGVTAGSLTWANLVGPNGHTHPAGRRHEPFNEASFIRAVVNGVDPAGNALLAAMPRYDLSREDSADLIAYLKRIASEVDPGLTETTITVGLMLPSKGALMDLGAAMKDVLTAYFDSINSGGGIFNRRIELKIVDGDGRRRHGSRCTDVL
jgi:mono/diheme cytochrome c family protein